MTDASEDYCVFIAHASVHTRVARQIARYIEEYAAFPARSSAHAAYGCRLSDRWYQAGFSPALSGTSRLSAAPAPAVAPMQNRNRQQRVGKKWLAFLQTRGMITYADWLKTCRACLGAGAGTLERR